MYRQRDAAKRRAPAVGRCANRMKHLITLIVALITGCTTVNKSVTNDFERAVLNSIENHGDQKDLVITMNDKGDLFIDDYPLKLSDIENIRQVKSLPNDPPNVILRADYRALHTDIHACFDALAESGIRKVTFQARKTEDAQHAPPAGRGEAPRP